MDIKPSNFPVICRVCLEHSQDDSLINISSFKIIEMLTACSTVEVYEDDGLPNQICESCLNNLSDAYRLKLLCEKSDQELRQALKDYNCNTSKTIKCEIKDLNNSIEIKSEVDYDENFIDNEDIICNEIMNYPCDKCSEQFDQSSYLASHYKQVHKSKGIKCKKCYLVCYHPIYLEEHQKSHKNNENCRNKINSKQKGLHHYKCNVCNQTFLHKSRLAQHKYKHETDRPFSCEKCDSTFKAEKTLAKHVKSVHTDYFQNETCHICGKSVKNLTSHLFVHEEREKIECKLCSKEFMYKENLKKHIKQKHSGPRHYNYLCSICGYGADTPALLQVHLRKHTGEKPYACDKCDKKYKTQSHLNAHIYHAHLDIRKYICSVCARGFHKKLTLDNHMRTHTGERPFECNFCNKTFSFKSAWRAHIIKLHPQYTSSRSSLST